MIARDLYPASRYANTIRLGIHYTLSILNNTSCRCLEMPSGMIKHIQGVSIPAVRRVRAHQNFSHAGANSSLACDSFLLCHSQHAQSAVSHIQE